MAIAACTVLAGSGARAPRPAREISCALGPESSNPPGDGLSPISTMRVRTPSSSAGIENCEMPFRTNNTTAAFPGASRLAPTPTAATPAIASSAPACRSRAAVALSIASARNGWLLRLRGCACRGQTARRNHVFGAAHKCWLHTVGIHQRHQIVGDGIRHRGRRISGEQQRHWLGRVGIHNQRSRVAFGAKTRAIDHHFVGVALRESGCGAARGIIHHNRGVDPGDGVTGEPRRSPAFRHPFVQRCGGSRTGSWRAGPRLSACCRGGRERLDRAGGIHRAAHHLRDCRVCRGRGLACRLTNCERFATVLVPVLLQVLGAGLSPSPGWTIGSPMLAPSLRAKT
jgi:hypothetical protein